MKIPLRLRSNVTAPARSRRGFLAAACAVASALAGCGGSPFSSDGVAADDASTDAGPVRGPESGAEAGPGSDGASPADASEEGHADASPGADSGSGPADSGPREAGPADAGADAPACPAGQLQCAGGCVPVGVSHCGACDVACSGATPVCNGTACVSGCSGTTPTFCVASQTCVDTTNDPLNCGTCGNACPVPAGGVNVCVSSQCVPSCPASSPNLCTAVGPMGSCVDFQNDPANCGACANACGQGSNPPAPANGTSTCTSGTCGFQCATGYTACIAQWTCHAPPAASAAYVSIGSGFTAPNCGGSAAPCATLKDGVAYAIAQGLQNIYIAHGTYGMTDGPIVLAPSGALAVHGGWTFTPPSTWTPDCAATASTTVIGAPSGAMVALQVSSGIVTLGDLTVENSSTAAAGQSLYGILASGAKELSLSNVVVHVAGGGVGASGTTGAASAGVPATCAPGTGAAGATGSAGAPSYASSGYLSGGGGTGVGGSNGATGAAGAPPTSSIKVELSCSALGTSACVPVTTTSTGSGGAGGCGSYGSGGGTGGGGGGSSIGVYVWGGVLSIQGGTITVGGGGAGGPGGGGGMQVSGAAGQAGVAGPLDCTAAICGAVTNGCPRVGCTAFGSAPAGGTGSPGGEGGIGGQGGGGSGGDSYCYYLGAGATAMSTVGCVFGAAGGGGAPNGPDGHANPYN